MFRKHFHNLLSSRADPLRIKMGMNTHFEYFAIKTKWKIIFNLQVKPVRPLAQLRPLPHRGWTYTFYLDPLGKVAASEYKKKCTSFPFSSLGSLLLLLHFYLLLCSVLWRRPLGEQQTEIYTTVIVDVWYARLVVYYGQQQSAGCLPYNNCGRGSRSS